MRERINLRSNPVSSERLRHPPATMPENTLSNSPTEALRICIVDDRPEIRDLIKLILLGRGYRFGLAGSAAHARDVARELQPHFVLLDVHLPGGGSGFELCRELKSESSLTPVVILMSASSELAFSERARAAGPDGYAADSRLHAEVFDYIGMFYKPEHRHSSRNGLSPVKFEQQFRMRNATV